MTQINAQTLKFLTQLSKNNNKPWFEAHRTDHEVAKAEFLSFNTEILTKLQSMDTSLLGLEAKKTIFRINRDVRFSKDKSPYKNNMGSAISSGGKNMQTAGYYFQIQPGNNSFMAAGAYMPMPDRLQSIRQEIDYNLNAFKKIVLAPAFKKQFVELDQENKLKTVPKGYTPDNPAIEFLKLKSFVVSRNFTDKEVLSRDFQKQLIQSFKTAFPLLIFLNTIEI